MGMTVYHEGPYSIYSALGKSRDHGLRLPRYTSTQLLIPCVALASFLSLCTSISSSQYSPHRDERIKSVYVYKVVRSVGSATFVLAVTSIRKPWRKHPLECWPHFQPHCFDLLQVLITSPIHLRQLPPNWSLQPSSFWINLPCRSLVNLS